MFALCVFMKAIKNTLQKWARERSRGWNDVCILPTCLYIVRGCYPNIDWRKIFQGSRWMMEWCTSTYSMRMYRVDWSSSFLFLFVLLFTLQIKVPWYVRLSHTCYSSILSKSNRLFRFQTFFSFTLYLSRYECDSCVQCITERYRAKVKIHPTFSHSLFMVERNVIED